MKLDDINSINYYIGMIQIYNIGVRDLREKIKSNEYERIGYREELSKPKVNILIKNPIIIKTDKYDEAVSRVYVTSIDTRKYGCFFERAWCWIYLLWS